MQVNHLFTSDTSRQDPLLKRLSVLVEVKHGDFTPLNLGGDISYGLWGEPQLQQFCDLNQRSALTGQYLWGSTPNDLWPKIAQLCQSRSVKRASADAIYAERRKPSAQLMCRLRGEGECEHSLRGVGANRDTVCNAVRDCFCFTRASSSQDAHWATQRLGDLSLLVRESGKNLLSLTH
jgi:hypothetical protein